MLLPKVTWDVIQGDLLWEDFSGSEWIFWINKGDHGRIAISLSIYIDMREQGLGLWSETGRTAS